VRALAYHFEREVRAVPLWAMRDYLLKVGGKEVGAGLFRGEGWEDAFYSRLEPMLWRGGG